MLIMLFEIPGRIARIACGRMIRRRVMNLPMPSESDAID